VAQGDTMYTIADRFGISDWRTICDHADNAALRAKRPHPHVLEPGDVVAIPDAEPPRKVVLDGRTQFTRRARDQQILSVTLLHPNFSPISDTEVTLSIDGSRRTLKTDARGVLQVEVPIDARRVTVVVRDDVWDLDIGHLNPLRETRDDGRSGCAARLHNLGYIDRDANDDEIAEAIRRFQLDHNVPRTGALDGETVRALIDRHGC
jgi:N-acetylmuramoyl-L-alanine amidase